MHCLMHCLMHWLDALLDSRSTRFPFTYPFAARAPCDSQGSECQCGIHTAEATSALRSRKTERAAKEKADANPTHFFLALAAPGTHTRPEDRRSPDLRAAR